MLPANMTQEQADAIKSQMKGMAYAALGTAAIAKKDYADAEKNLKESSKLYAGDPLVWLRLAYALDKQNKYAEGVTPASNCLQYASDQPQVATLCKTERDRLVKLSQSPAPTHWPTRMVAAMATPNTTPSRKNSTMLAFEAAVSAAGERQPGGTPRGSSLGSPAAAARRDRRRAPALRSLPGSRRAGTALVRLGGRS